MPMWGEEHDWEGIQDCVRILREELPEASQVKEKFGYIRCYMGGPLDEDRYRAAYKKAVDAHPELARYILNDADYPELLRGLVSKSDCKHPSGWRCADNFRCGICMEKFTFDEWNKIKEK